MKRLFDIFLSGTGLLVFSPVMVVLCLAGAVSFGGKVFFRQQRPGFRGRSFWILKFRTMTDVEDRHGNPLPDAERLTRYGRMLRKTSLDELPELWNVFVGEMSLVGPRPLLTEYLPLYSAEQARRHEVRPGLTGWSQVNGRNDLDWEERLAKDVWYVDNRSCLLDIEILFRTIGTVFQARGVSQKGEATMQPFRGSDGKQPENAIDSDRG